MALTDLQTSLTTPPLSPELADYRGQSFDDFNVAALDIATSVFLKGSQMLRNEQDNVAINSSAASFERPIDLVHLARQTLGDRSLEQEILALYVKQSQSLLDKIEQIGCGRERSDFAHMLVGSSRAVGAWQVASAAEVIEVVAPGQDQEFAQAVKNLRTCVAAACETILNLQRAH